ncbi:hypothetical protein ASZ90_008924 [hydrocarbon metagenome]|uniref:Uncharacterized protein n=1 Tax=hydrocarbon metagenome TaxID=938273 RepID=A0A0W8FKE7_9ZZZZ
MGVNVPPGCNSGYFRDGFNASFVPAVHGEAVPHLPREVSGICCRSGYFSDRPDYNYEFS